MPTPQVFNSFKAAVANGIHDLDTDTLLVALTNVAPVLTNTVLADITQITGAGTYAPEAAAVTSSAQAGGTYSLAIDTVTFAASGADYDQFRYVVLYNDTAASDPLICFYDRGAGYVLPDGQSFVIQAGTWLQNA
jgi:hypothetical protein